MSKVVDPPRLNLLPHPSAAPEKHDAGYGNGSFCDDDGEERAFGTKMEADSQTPCQRQLQHPEAEEIYDGRGQGVACTVERLQHHHGVRVADIAATDGAQRHGGDRNHIWIAHKEADDGRGKYYEENTDGPQE